MTEVKFLNYMIGMKKAALACCKNIVGDGDYFRESDVFFLGHKKVVEHEIDYLEKQVKKIIK